MDDTAKLAPQLLTPKQAAERLGLAVSTLAKLRCLTSDGPVFVRLGSAVRYPADALAEFIDRQPRHRRTSDASTPAAKP